MLEVSPSGVGAVFRLVRDGPWSNEEDKQRMRTPCPLPPEEGAVSHVPCSRKVSNSTTARMGESNQDLLILFQAMSDAE